MISFRQHLLTIVAVFLALAVGVVLGGGPLAEVSARQADDTPRVSAAEASPAAAFESGFASAVAPGLVASRLAEQSVAVVTLPGADEQVVTTLTEQVVAAGGTIASRLDLADAVVDPGQKSLVDTLGSQLMTQQAGGAVVGEPSTYDRFGQLLGLAAASKEPGGEGATRKTRAIADALVGADLLPAAPEGAQRAPLVLVVLGEDAGDPSTDAIVAGLAAGLAAQAVGVVVAGTSADGDGQLGRLRSDPVAATVGTVDGVETPAGVASAVLLLARSLTTPGGSFGASGSDGPVPLG